MAKKTSGAAVPKPRTAEEYLRGLSPDLRKQTEALRKIILGVDSRIREEIKWNAPSYALDEHFLTFNAWTREGAQLIFHHGPKKWKASSKTILAKDEGLEWLSADRAIIRFSSMGDIEKRRNWLKLAVKTWLGAMSGE